MSDLTEEEKRLLTPEEREICELAEKATAGNLDTAEAVENDTLRCPMCDGEGDVDATAWVNIDTVPLTIQICGIGDALTNYESYFRAVTPPSVKSLLRTIASLRGSADLRKKEDAYTQGFLAAREMASVAIEQYRMHEPERVCCAGTKHKLAAIVRAIDAARAAHTKEKTK